MQTSYTLENNTMYESTELNFLGTAITSNLKLNVHTDNVAGLCNFR